MSVEVEKEEASGVGRERDREMVTGQYYMLD